MIYADFVHQFYTRPETGDLSLVGSIDRPTPATWPTRP
jgi:hypothetical protein